MLDLQKTLMDIRPEVSFVMIFSKKLKKIHEMQHF